MTSKFSSLIAFLCIWMTLPLTATAQTVDFPDPNLRSAINTALNKPPGAPITVAEMTSLQTLFASNSNISDLTGLEHATNLGVLDLGFDDSLPPQNSNNISDISALERLNLIALDLGGNNITDISALARLNLIALELGGNNIADISALSGMIDLTQLGLSVNNISDISAISGLTQLTKLYIAANNISNIAPIAGLTRLTDLILAANNILDIAPVARLTQLTRLDLSENNISDISPVAALTQLNTLRFLSNAISNIAAVAGLTRLTWLDLSANYIADISPIAGLTQLESLGLVANSITDISALAGLTRLTRMGLSGDALSDISALPGLTQLIRLSLGGDALSDLSPLSGLTQLESLFLFGTLISDLSAIAGLTQLTELYVRATSVTDISPLSGLTELTEIILTENNILDIAPLVANTGLGEDDRIDVRDNPISYPSIHTHIPVLASRGVGVKFDNRIPAALLKISGLATAQDNLLIVEVRDSEGRPFAGVPVRFTVIAGGGTLHVTRTSTDQNGRATSQLTLGTEGNTNIVQASVEGISTPVTFSYVAEIEVNIPDQNLRTALNTTLNKPAESRIITTEIETLQSLAASDANISDLTGLEHAIHLRELILDHNAITDISVLSNLTQLTTLRLAGNTLSDISAVAGLTKLTHLELRANNISDTSAVADLTALTTLNLAENSIISIAALSGLTHLRALYLQENSITDLSPLAENTGLGEGDQIDVRGNPLDLSAFDTHIPTLTSRGVTVQFDDHQPPPSTFDLSLPKGISLIHIPLKVETVNGEAKTVTRVGDLYDALGGPETVNLLISYDSNTQQWRSYLGPQNRGKPSDKVLTDELGLIATMKASVSVQFSGTALGTDGSSSITLRPGINLVGVPLKDESITRVSDLFGLEGIEGNVDTIIVSDDGDFRLVAQAGDSSDILLTGGQSFILIARMAATVAFTGEGWTSEPSTSTAPPIDQTELPSLGVTPILAVTGSIVAHTPKQNYRITVKNLTTGKIHTTRTDDDEVGYQLTFVDLETGRAVQVGDVLEISAEPQNPAIGVQPLRHRVTAFDVRQPHIQLDKLITYEIPEKTELLRNYPNPFNPETWIPYRLAEDAFVTLTIYDLSGHAIRRLNIGHQKAAIYENRDKAIYWDGRNEIGERVASGIYFYHLSTGDYSATRKMIVLK